MLLGTFIQELWDRRSHVLVNVTLRSVHLPWPPITSIVTGKDQDGKTVIHPTCLDQDTPLIAYNPEPFARTWVRRMFCHRRTASAKLLHHEVVFVERERPARRTRSHVIGVMNDVEQG